VSHPTPVLQFNSSRATPWTRIQEFVRSSSEQTLFINLISSDMGENVR
jgi:hypothetical protein